MKIAVLRYSLNLQTDADSSVGGGKLTRAVLTRLVDAGHDVTVVGPAGKNTIDWLRANAVTYSPDTFTLARYQACAVLTGPRNSFYGPTLANTYRLLATLPLDARAAYLQWDCALPFAFHPEFDSGLAKAGCSWQSISHLNWFVFAQGTDPACRAQGGGKSIGYDKIGFQFKRCFFELEEMSGVPLAVECDVVPKFAYFGSDRPGRLREFKRWFHQPNAPAVDVYGRWSVASKVECQRSNVTFMPHCPEAEVQHRLNRYLATLYIADAAYVKSDFVAQRFFENAQAGVVTLYSDRLQPSIACVVPDALKLTPAGFATEAERVRVASYNERQGMVELNRWATRSLADSSPHTLTRCVEEWLR